MEYGSSGLALMGLFTFLVPIGVGIFVLVMLYQMNQLLKRIADRLDEN